MINKLFLVGMGIALGCSSMMVNGQEDRWPSSEDREGQDSQRKMRPPMGMGGGGGSAIAVSDGAVFVVTQGQILRFDEKTLKQEAKASLPMEGGSGQSGGEKKPGMGGGDMGPGGGGGPEDGEDRGQGGDRRGQGGGQKSPMMGGGGGSVALTAANGSLYILARGKLYKYDAKTLYLQGTVEITTKEDKAKRQAEDNEKRYP